MPLPVNVSKRRPSQVKPLLCENRPVRCFSNGTLPPTSMSMSGEGAREEQKASYVINTIPVSRWKDGIPAVMGAHLMASGNVAPISTSTGPGEGGEPHMFQYHTEATDTDVCQFMDFDGAARGMVAKVAGLAAQAIEQRGAFAVAISGGSMLKALSHFASAKGVDFSKWWVFFVDERNVPHSSDDSTYKGAKTPFLNAVDIPANQVIEIHERLTPQQAATNYEGRMLDISTSALPRNDDGLPALDCILLGTGPDGHVASLFPNSSNLAVSNKWVIPVTDSPKPPKERITFTLPVINAAKACIFLATGGGKAEVVHRVLECQALPGALPAQLVRPSQGSVTWLLDVESSSQLEIASWDNKKAHPRSSV